MALCQLPSQYYRIPTQRIARPRRRIVGISAILFPFAGGKIDWAAFAGHVARTAAAGLIPAVNMDTGYVNLLDDAARRRCSQRETFSAAARSSPVRSSPTAGSRFDRDAYLRQVEPIVRHEGTPVIFQSYGLTGQADDEIVAAYAEIGRYVDGFIGFELGEMFAQFGKIYSLDMYRGLLGMSMQRRQALVPAPRSGMATAGPARPGAARFPSLTGNDLAIDMVMYGSDYLLGLSTFAPDLFAKRDAYWAAGDPAFHELNDVLQYLGFFAFRAPVPAYKHSAAIFLHLRGWIASDATHPKSPTRPASDRAILREIGRQLKIAMRE